MKLYIVTIQKCFFHLINIQQTSETKQKAKTQRMTLNMDMIYLLLRVNLISLMIHKKEKKNFNRKIARILIEVFRVEIFDLLELCECLCVFVSVYGMCVCERER